jgi:hypothetical protein
MNGNTIAGGELLSPNPGPSWHAIGLTWARSTPFLTLSRGRTHYAVKRRGGNVRTDETLPAGGQMGALARPLRSNLN